jgi:hypothetical protein
MKYKALIKKLIDKAASLTKTKKELVPLHVSLTSKSFNELQEDLVINHKTLEDDYKLKETDDPKKFTIKNPQSPITGIIEIV